MEAEARTRIEAASGVLAARYGVDVPTPVVERKADMVMLRHLEAQAGFLEALAATTSPEPALAPVASPVVNRNRR